MTNEILISFIVPVYNVEKTLLNECLQSLQKINRKDIEFIVINDGSSDKNVLLTFKNYKEDERFVLIDKPNSGVGDTRNIGIRISKGNYIFFVDADDLFEYDKLNLCLNYIVENKYDIINLNAKEINSKGKVITNNLFGNENIAKFGSGVVWAKFFKRIILVDNNINFDVTLKFLEDLKFMNRTYSVIKNFLTLPNIYIYIHRMGIESTCTKYNPSILNDFDNALFANINEDYQTTLQSALWMFIHFVLPNYYYHKECKIKNKKKQITEDLNKTVIFKDLKTIDFSKLTIKQKLKFKLFIKEKYYLLYLYDKIRRLMSKEI